MCDYLQKKLHLHSIYKILDPVTNLSSIYFSFASTTPLAEHMLPAINFLRPGC